MTINSVWSIGTRFFAVRGLVVGHGNARVPAALCDIVQRQIPSDSPPLGRQGLHKGLKLPAPILIIRKHVETGTGR